MNAASCNPPLRTYLGLDCGGTASVALLADDQEHCLQRLQTGPANVRLLTDPDLAQHFRALASRMPQPTAVGIGMAGVIREPERERVRVAAAQAWPDLPCWVGNDLETAFAAGGDWPTQAGVARVVVISGTGASCYGRNRRGHTAFVGGWGHLLGDRGSGYDVAVRSLRTVLRQFDTTGAWPTLGTRLLRALLLNSPNELVTWAQAASKADTAALAVEVFAAAADEDRLAQAVIVEAAEALAQDAVACARRLAKAKEPVQVLLTGSLLLKQAPFAWRIRRLIRSRLPKAQVNLLEREAAWGAVEMARRQGADSAVAPHPDRTHATNRGPEQRPRNTVVPTASGLSPTEQRNPRSMNLAQLSIADAVKLMLSEDARIPKALLRESAPIERAIRLITQAFRRGGRLFYVGAGTSGRLGVLDASECPPTFSVSPERVQGIIAGGQAALWNSIEGAEDDVEAGAHAIHFRGVTHRDVVVGIAASGRTPFVWGALAAAKERHARTIFVAFNPRLRIARPLAPTLVITPAVGPEVLTGSTRLKAGTATKLLLNLFTTISMVQLDKVIENLMVDVHPANAKLRDRAVRIVQQLTGAERNAAEQALAASGWVVRKAVSTLQKPRILP